MLITFRPEKNPNNWRIFLSTKISILQHGTPNMIKPQPDWPLHCLRWLMKAFCVWLQNKMCNLNATGKFTSISYNLPMKDSKENEIYYYKINILKSWKDYFEELVSLHTPENDALITPAIDTINTKTLSSNP